MLRPFFTSSVLAKTNFVLAHLYNFVAAVPHLTRASRFLLCIDFARRSFAARWALEYFFSTLYFCFLSRSNLDDFFAAVLHLRRSSRKSLFVLAHLYDVVATVNHLTRASRFLVECIFCTAVVRPKLDSRIVPSRPPICFSFSRTCRRFVFAAIVHLRRDSRKNKIVLAHLYNFVAAVPHLTRAHRCCRASIGYGRRLSLAELANLCFSHFAAILWRI